MVGWCVFYLHRLLRCFLWLSFCAASCWSLWNQDLASWLGCRHSVFYAKEFWYMWTPSECKTTRTYYSQWQKSQIPGGQQALEVLWSDTNWLGSDSALHRRSLQHVQSFKLPGSWWRRRNLADEWDRVGCWTFETKIHVLSTNRPKHKPHHHLPHLEAELPSDFVFRKSMPYIFCHREPELQIGKERFHGQLISNVFFVSFFTTSPAAAGQCPSGDPRGVRLTKLCGQICSLLRHVLCDRDSVLPSISLWKAACRVASGQDDNSHMTPFQPMQLSFLILLQFRWCSWHILPRLQASSRVIWLCASLKFLVQPKRHHRRTKTHGVWWLQLQDTSQCSIMAVHLGCITSIFLLLNGPFPCTSDLLILSHAAISQSQVQVRVAGGTVFVKRLGECRDSELNLEAELLSFIHGDDVKLRERQLNLVRITELKIWNHIEIYWVICWVVFFTQNRSE